MIKEGIICLGKLDNSEKICYNDSDEYYNYHGVKLYKNQAYRDITRRIAQKFFPNHNITVVNARLHNMKPGLILKEHADTIPPDDEYFHVLHLPIKTNKKAFLAFGQHKTHLKQDYIYEINYGTPHWGANEGTENRIHLFMEIYAHNKEDK